ncbi:MAG: ABC transporter substrate-binding protein [Thermomicrobiales bacterium]|nr:ABC transporter substrate-binding protein [Thermomicrobiales bacterium]
MKNDSVLDSLATSLDHRQVSRRRLMQMAAATGLAAPAASGLLFVQSVAAQDGESGGEIVVGLDWEMDNLDPAVTPYAVSHWVMMNIFDTLVWRGTDGTFYPGLADSWEINEDGTVYTFTLKQGVTFHDGTPFNAEAVKFTFDHIVDPETRSGFASSLLGPYDQTEVIDEFTAAVHFSAPYAPFLDSASQAFLGIPSPTAVQADREAFLRNPVGTGFMKFVEWVQNSHIALERNDDYNWASPVFAHEGPAYLDKITFRFYLDNPTRLAALEAGDANLVQGPLLNEIPRLNDSSDFATNVPLNPGLPATMFCDTTKAPTDDLAVRQALNIALDRELIVQIGMFGQSRGAYGPLWETTPYYSAEVEELYPFDPERAKQVLEEAGWVEGSDGIREKDGQRLTVSLPATDFTTPFDELSQGVWKDVGIELELIPMDGTAADEAIANSEVNLYNNSWVSSDPVVLNNLFLSKNIDGGFNWSKWANEELDELLTSGEATVDEEERTEIYRQIQAHIMENALIVPVYGNPGAAIAYESRYNDVKQDFRNYLWLYDVTVS